LEWPGTKTLKKVIDMTYAYYTNNKVLTIYDNLVGNNGKIIYQVKVSGKVEAKKICKEKGAKQWNF